MTKKEFIEKMQANGIANLEEKMAVIDRIDRITFRAESALYNEISLAYDEAALSETREEREPYLERVRNCEVSLHTLVGTTKRAITNVVTGEAPCEIGSFYEEIDSLSDDDEAIVNYLVRSEKEVKAELVKLVGRAVAEAFEGDGDES